MGYSDCNKTNIKDFEIVETILWFIVMGVVVWGLYIGMVLEPKCEQKGFAGVDKNGCFIYLQENKVYEKTN